jgi:hypothetical protein
MVVARSVAFCHCLPIDTHILHELHVVARDNSGFDKRARQNTHDNNNNNSNNHDNDNDNEEDEHNEEVDTSSSEDTHALDRDLYQSTYLCIHRDLYHAYIYIYIDGLRRRRLVVVGATFSFMKTGDT